MAIKTFATGEVLSSSDTNTYLANSGLVYVTQTSFAGLFVAIDGCFTSTYRDYEVIISCNTSAGGPGFYRYQERLATVNAVTNYTSVAVTYSVAGGTQTNANLAGAQANTSGIVSASYAGAAISSGTKMTVYGPRTTAMTNISWQGSGNTADSGLVAGSGSMIHYVNTAYDGFWCTFATSQTGVCKVYGYRQV